MPETTVSKQCDCDETTTININQNNPQGITTVTGQYPAWGFRGDIEIEYAFSGGKFILTTRRYNFTGVNAEKDPRFEVSGPSGAILAVTPLRNAGWVAWHSSSETNYGSVNLIFTFTFKFHVEPGGVTRSDRKTVHFAIEYPPLP